VKVLDEPVSKEALFGEDEDEAKPQAGSAAGAEQKEST